MESVAKERLDIDEDGYETVRRPRPRTLGQYMLEIFAVDVEKQVTKELSKNRFCGNKCSKKRCDHRSCKEIIQSNAKEIRSVERVVQKAQG